MNSLVSIFTLAALIATPFVSLDARAEAGEVSLCKTAFIDDKPVIREAAAVLEKAGLVSQTYVTDWHAKTDEGQGPYRASGSMMVVPVKAGDAAKWMEEIGEHSMGFMVEKLPEDIGHTAHLRIGNKIYTYFEVQSVWGAAPPTPNARPIPELLHILANNPSYSYTEITIPISKAERDALIEFLEERRSGKIIAQFDVKRGPKKGDVILPSFDEYDCTLMAESCGAAATSPFNPIWMDHYTKPGRAVLVAMAERLSLQPTQVAKRTIWSHIRNPQTPVMTLLGVDRTVRPALKDDFIHANSWGRLRGLPMYGLMPDPQDGETTTLKSKRTPLNEWLAENPAAPSADEGQ